MINGIDMYHLIVSLCICAAMQQVGCSFFIGRIFRWAYALLSFILYMRGDMDTPKDMCAESQLLEELNLLRAQAARYASVETELIHLNALGTQVSLALIQNATLHEMLHACTDALVQHLDAAFARIWVLNAETQVLELRASSGIYTHLNGDHSRIPMGQLKIGLIAQMRLPHLTNTVVGDPRVNDQEWAKREGMIAFAGYPLLIEDRVVGVMALFARHTLTRFVLDAMSSIANAVALGIDRKRSEEERDRLLIHEQHARAAELALQVRNTFLSNVSHDLRNPLTSIRATIQLWQRRLVQGQSLDINRLLVELTRLESQTMKMSRMIDDLLSIAQLQMGQQLTHAAHELDLVGLVRRVVHIQQSTTDLHHIVVEALVPELVVLGDSVLLERVCTNLLSNAIKYSFPRGMITVTVSKEEKENGSWAQLRVQDRGFGIPAEEVSHIFEPFYRASNVLDSTAGTGIGLASVSQIIEQYGGTIAVESEEGVGTTFTIHLPLMTRTVTA
jgi:signal transduction histidine kinase